MTTEDAVDWPYHVIKNYTRNFSVIPMTTVQQSIFLDQ